MNANVARAWECCDAKNDRLSGSAHAPHNPAFVVSLMFRFLTASLFLLFFGPMGNLFAGENVSFINDVQPILTRFACNSGGCHGKLAGQNGFRLSLRGYAPDADFDSIVNEAQGRRINRLEAERSLFLLKPTGQIAHGGGKLFDSQDAAYQILHRWILAGSSGIRPDEKQLTQLSAFPRSIQTTPGLRHRLSINATYSDESHRDVTWLTKFHSNDNSMATISADGEVTARRYGEVALVAAFQGQVDTVLLTIPYPADVDPSLYAQRDNIVDEHVFDKLRSLHIEPSGLCDDATYLRRVMLDLIGTLPTAAEARDFFQDTSVGKRQRLVDRLLLRAEFVDHWAVEFGDLFQNRRERGGDIRGIKGVRAFHQWIRQQVAINRPWDQIVRDVLLANGSTDDNPAVGYFVVTVGDLTATESDVGESVAQAFLGTRIGCAKCHNHPLEKYTQDDYYRFIAFFSRVALQRPPNYLTPTKLVIGSKQTVTLSQRIESQQQEFAKLREQTDADSASRITEKEKLIQSLQDELTALLSQTARVIQPRTLQTLFPQALDRQPVAVAVDSDPRQQLAQWITHADNHAFSGTFVNRVWKHFFSVGLVEMVDDLRPTNPPSNPALLERLCTEFVQAKFDIRQIMRLMVTSRAYQLSSETTPANKNETRFYSHYYVKRQPAEVLLDSLCQATGVRDSYPGEIQGIRAIQLSGPHIDSYFLMTFGRSDRFTACTCEKTTQVTLPQLLHLQNSPNILSKMTAPEGRLMQLLGSGRSAEQILDELYLNTLSRFPNDAERQQLLSGLQDVDRTESAVDLLWAILNSKEFTFNH